jgi:hypothetical protein
MMVKTVCVVISLHSQSKALKGFLQEWCMADDGWKLDGEDSKIEYKISELDDEKDREKIFYKTR